MSSNKILRRDKVVAELARHGQGARDVSLLHAASFMQRKRLCEANRCLDLAPVEFVLAQLGDVEMLDPRCLKEVAPHLCVCACVVVWVGACVHLRVRLCARRVGPMPMER